MQERLIFFVGGSDLKVFPANQNKHQSLRLGRDNVGASYQATLIRLSVQPECRKEFSNNGNMVAHYRSVHEGIKYSCNQCDYQATTQGHLHTHIAGKHSNKIFKCDHCDYWTKWRTDYNKHKRTAHAMTV